MFISPYFTPTYFAPTYFPELGGVIPPPPVSFLLVRVIDQTFISPVLSKQTLDNS